MNKEEFIKQRGQAAWDKKLKNDRERYARYPERKKVNAMERVRKGGKYYWKKLIYDHTGLQGKRNALWATHGNNWRSYKRIIAPGSQLHHQWRFGTAEYDGLALVEADQHMRGFIEIIQILEGKINIFTEKELRGEY